MSEPLSERQKKRLKRQERDALGGLVFLASLNSPWGCFFWLLVIAVVFWALSSLLYYWFPIALLVAAFFMAVIMSGEDGKQYRKMLIPLMALTLIFSGLFFTERYEEKHSLSAEDPKTAATADSVETTTPSEAFAPNGITPLSFVETMGRDPEYLQMGQECSTYETGTMCQWGETDYFKSATVTHRSFEHYTVLLIDPKFPTEGLENGTLSAPEASGALEGGHSKLTVTNNGERQLFIQSSVAYAAQ